MEWQRLGDLRTELGESPVWDDRRRLVFMVDLTGCKVHALDLAGRLAASWDFDSQVCSLGLCDSGRLVIALAHRVVVFDPETAIQTSLASFPGDAGRMRFNDGKVGPDGHFWVGSMDQGTPHQAIGSVYRIGADGHVRTMIEGMRIANGLAWSLDGAWLYHSDSRGTWIDRYAFDATSGRISDGLRIATPQESDGRPDGAACDVDGNYWSAGVSAGCLNRYSPDGVLIEKLSLSVASPTMPCFCGDDLRMLMVTSHSGGALMPAGSMPAGSVILGQSPVAGVPVARMKGL